MSRNPKGVNLVNFVHLKQRNYHEGRGRNRAIGLMLASFLELKLDEDAGFPEPLWSC
jgi:hypothetical protein